MTAWTPPSPPRTGSRAGRVVLLVIGAFAALAGVALMVGGGVLVWAHATQRDAAGYYTTSTERFRTSSYALTSRIDLGRAPGEHDWTVAHPVGTVRVRVRGGARPVFVGVARETAVDSWLRGVAHTEVTGANFGPFHTTTKHVEGTRAASRPAAASFWVASADGPGLQTLHWTSASGRWRIVVMNADARPGVNVAVDVGAKTGVLLPIGLAVGGFGVLLLVGAALAMFFALRASAGPSHARAPEPRVPDTYPARLNGHLDPAMSRWLWLVKGFLVIPHAIVLAFLWIAVVVLTFVAGVAILFTGRYPRSIFDFNVGVMRWTWRVSFYTLGGFATDKYPPFSLRSDPRYPADYDVDYPERLSRGLVLVKWWLLAIPQYIVVAFFAGGWAAGSERYRVAGGLGLIGVLALIAAVVLTVRGRYPDSIFDFVMGMNRWCFRVLAYAALLRDEYPPFRLDSGGLDPGSVGVPPGPTSPPGSPPAPQPEEVLEPSISSHV